jgi:hypothetical protein
MLLVSTVMEYLEGFDSEVTAGSPQPTKTVRQPHGRKNVPCA